MENKKKLLIFLICLLSVFAVALIGSIFTTNTVNSEWYEQIKPDITPPNFVFPIVWNILFVLIAISLYFVWINSKKKDKNKILLAYGVNFFLNILWSALYFGIRKPNYAFIEIFFLWASILYLILMNCKIDKKASYLLIPYLLWVGFATYLNFLSF
jgi:translocator protein